MHGTDAKVFFIFFFRFGYLNLWRERVLGKLPRYSLTNAERCGIGGRSGTELSINDYADRRECIAETSGGVKGRTGKVAQSREVKYAKYSCLRVCNCRNRTASSKNYSNLTDALYAKGERGG